VVSFGLLFYVILRVSFSLLHCLRNLNLVARPLWKIMSSRI